MIVVFVVYFVWISCLLAYLRGAFVIFFGLFVLGWLVYLCLMVGLNCLVPFTVVAYFVSVCVL